MKKLYHFSKTDLQFVELKNFKLKLCVSFGAAVILFTCLLFAIYSIFANSRDSNDLKAENILLKNKIIELSELYNEINSDLQILTKTNNELRIAANLKPLTADENLLGVGGRQFDDLFEFNESQYSSKLTFALDAIDEVARKVKFEKKQYLEISRKLQDNKKLFESIPAIKPCSGFLGMEGFGMRMHPILRVNKMHEGIDILTDSGTPVFATGKGIISFVGNKGGYGLTVEIDHGFGYRTIYAHLSKTEIGEGTAVKRGTQIAWTGNTGLSSGPHLHYEVHHNGTKLDPSCFFFDGYDFLNLTQK